MAISRVSRKFHGRLRVVEVVCRDMGAGRGGGEIIPAPRIILLTLDCRVERGLSNVSTIAIGNSNRPARGDRGVRKSPLSRESAETNDTWGSGCRQLTDTCEVHADACEDREVAFFG